jgi:uncharacterized protein with GYD domain
MPKYLSLFSYSSAAKTAMIGQPGDRDAPVRAALESVGARLEMMYWMFGAYDGVAVVDAPDSITMAGIATAISSTGTVSSETHELFTSEELQRILGVASTVRPHFARPGEAG